MTSEQRPLESVKTVRRSLRKRLTLKDEFILALFPTVTVLLVLLFVEAVSRQRVLFASLASSAFLIYLDPEHSTNNIRTLITAQLAAATLGLIGYLVLGPSYLAGGLAMVGTIVVMIFIDAVHPPAMSTSLIFAFRAGDESNLVLFALAVAMTAVLVILERALLWLLGRVGHG